MVELVDLVVEALRRGVFLGHVPSRRTLNLRVEGEKFFVEYVEEPMRRDYEKAKEIMQTDMTYEDYLNTVKVIMLAAAQRIMELQGFAAKFEKDRIYAETDCGYLELKIEENKMVMKVEGCKKHALYPMLAEMFAWLEPYELGEVNAILEDVRLRKAFTNFLMFVASLGKGRVAKPTGELAEAELTRKECDENEAEDS